MKKKVKSVTHPHGQSFDAVRYVKESHDVEDPYLIFDLDDGYETGLPFVVKSSRRKVQIMRHLDRTGLHALNETVVHLDVVQSRTKGMKTYTLSYYDIRLNSMVVLCTMDTISECKEACQLFFEKIEEMIVKHVSECGEATDKLKFQPFHLKDDENGANKVGMAKVLGKHTQIILFIYI